MKESINHHHHRPYGVGVSYRFTVHDDIMANRDSIDLLEISTEDYIVRERLLGCDPDKAKLREALQAFPSVAHGISLSLGSVEEPKNSYIRSTLQLLEEERIEIFSEHLAFHSMDGNDLTLFLEMPFEEESVAWVKRKHDAVCQVLGRPFALENVTYYFPVPHGSMSEADFFRRIGEELDCTFLLDVTNVFNNAHNHGYDPIEFFDRYPMERVSQMHLAGGHRCEDGRWEDSHSANVMEPVWPLFEEAVKRTNCEIVILERDSRLRPFESVQEDIDQAREIFYRHRPEQPEGENPFPNELPVGFSGPALNPEAPEFAQLRAFQRTLMGRITDPKFHHAFDHGSQAAIERFGLSDPLWRKRLEDCDRGFVHRLAESWQNIQVQEKEVEEEYQTSEWAAWAEELGVDPETETAVP